MRSANSYKPELSLKKPSALRKVQLLEEAVLKGSLSDLTAVLDTYKPFEFTARALGIAGRYRGVEFVRALLQHDATFWYVSDLNLQRKYGIEQKTVAGCYCTEYFLMLIPEKLVLSPYAYHYTPMYGIGSMDLSEELESMTLPAEERLASIKLLMAEDSLDAVVDEMLFWALVNGETAMADALTELGADLKTTAPAYYFPDRGAPPPGYQWAPEPTYLETVTTGAKSVYWTAYTSMLTRLDGLQKPPDGTI